MSGTIPLREAALAAIADRLATQLPDIAVERARRAPVDTDAEPLPRLVVRGDDLEADDTQEPGRTHYRIGFGVSGSLDRSPGIVGGLKPRIRLRVLLRGSGTPANAPEWGRLLRCCTFSETTNAALAATALPAAGHNPEATEGYDPAVPVERDARGSIDPLMNTTTAVALFNAFRQGTAMSLMAILGATAGNRFCVIAPAAKATGLRPGDRDGLGQFDITFQLDGADSPLFLAQF